LKDVQLVRTESNFFRNSIPQRHYVTVYISGRAVDESQLRNLEPDKCDGWEWVDARDILAEDGIYRPLFVPLKELFSVMGLVEPGLRN
jgi:8-oxo-dGTP diphosphatase